MRRTLIRDLVTVFWARFISQFHSTIFSERQILLRVVCDFFIIHDFVSINAAIVGRLFIIEKHEQPNDWLATKQTLAIWEDIIIWYLPYKSAIENMVCGGTFLVEAF